MCVNRIRYDFLLAAAVVDRTTSANVDVLETLTGRSLLHTQRDDSSNQLRYRLLETIRVYAYQRLVKRGMPKPPATPRQHHLADRLDVIGHMPSAMLPADYPLADDAIAAVEWAHASNDTTLGARLGVWRQPDLHRSWTPAKGRGLPGLGRPRRRSDPTEQGLHLPRRSHPWPRRARRPSSGSRTSRWKPRVTFPFRGGHERISCE